MTPFHPRRLLLLPLLALCVLLLAGCGTLENELHITYRSPTHTVTMLTLRGTGPMEDLLLAGQLRDALSNAGWSVSSDDGGDGPATLSATYESTNGNPFPDMAARNAAVNPSQAIVRDLNATAEDGLFTRQITVKFNNQPGVLGAPQLADPRAQQVLDALLAALGRGPRGSSGALQDNPFVDMNLDRDSFDRMLDAVLTLRVSVTVPGTVRVTNADERSGNTVTWKLTAGSLRESREYYVVSEEIIWAKVGAAAAAVLMFVAAFALLGAYLVGRLRPRPAPAAAAATPADAAAAGLFQPPDKTPEELAALRLPDHEEAESGKPEGSGGAGPGRS
jgi:hypothetical protein